MEITGKGLKLLQTIADTSARSKTVQASQTIQEVIDRCSVAAGSLRTGFTNPVVVKVPTGHETEFYSLVRNASDVATDKRNVKVIFEDNPEGKFIVEQINDCESLTDWTSDGTLVLDEDHRFTGDHCIEVDNVDTLLLVMYNDTDIDLTGCCGFLVDMEFNPDIISYVYFFIKDVDNNYLYSRTVQPKYGSTRETIYFPIDFSTMPAGLDMSQIDKYGLRVNVDAGEIDTFYFDNIRAVKATQTKEVILEIHSALSPLVLGKFEEYGYKANVFQVIDWMGSGSNLYEYARNQIKMGHLVGSDSVSHADMTDYTREQTAYEIFAANNWLYFMGVKKGFGWYTFADLHTNKYGKELVDQLGGGCIDAYGGFLPLSSIIFDLTGAYTSLDSFIERSTGRIVKITMTGPYTEANLTTFFDYISENFSKVLLFDDLPGRYPDNWPASFHPSKNYVPCLKKKTLTDDEEIEIWQGGTFLFDPGGAARDVTPVGSGIPYIANHEVKIINDADAAEALTFDPTFTAVGTHDGLAEADTLTYSLGGWSVGQLVGRTVNNTADSSSGVITANTATTVSAILSGGTNNYWSIGDTFTITPAGLNQAVGEDQTATFVYDGEGWDIINLYDKSP